MEEQGQAGKRLCYAKSWTLCSRGKRSPFMSRQHREKLILLSRHPPVLGGERELDGGVDVEERAREVIFDGLLPHSCIWLNISCFLRGSLL